MFGLSRRERLQREVDELELQNRAADLRASIATKTAIENAAGGTYPLSDPLAFEKLFGPFRETISADRAMRHSTVFGCVRIITGAVSMLPFVYYRKGEKGHRERIDDAPLARMIDRRPNPRLSASMFWRSIVANMLLEGNGVAWIERRGAVPVRLQFIPWNRTGVRLQIIANEPVQVYTLTLDDGRQIVAHQDDVLHIPGSPIWDIFRAMTPIAAYSMSVGIGLSADQFAKAYFDNGSHPDGYISYPSGANLKKDHGDEIRKHWMSKYGGDNRFAGPAVLTEGGKFEPLRINAADAQLLDTRKFSAEDIATRIFGVPAPLIGLGDKTSNWGTGIEQLLQAFTDFTLGPHLQAIEDEVNYKLIRDDRYVAEFDREAFVRGDLKARMEALRMALGGNNGPGLMTPNEGRRRLNMGASDDPNADRLVSWPPSPAVAPAAEESEPQEPPRQRARAKSRLRQ